ncbi:MAG: diguanylate cyclase [Pseudomonadota bacterium]
MDKQSVEQFKLRILQENARDGGFALMMACVVYAALLVNHLETKLVVPWLMVAVTLVALRFTIIARYFGANVGARTRSFVSTVKLNVVLLAMLGLMFGMTPFLYGTNNYLMLAFTNLWCAGIAAALFVSQGVVPSIAYAFAIPALAPLLGLYLLSGDMELTLVGMGNLLILGFLLIFSSRIREAFLEEVMHRTKYERLASHYEEEKAKTEYLVNELYDEVERRKSAEVLIRKAREEAENKSNYDFLTGLPNRRIFEKALAREWFRAMRNRDSLSLVVCKVDAFSAYRERYGVHASDQCIVRIADSISDNKRGGDFLARYGNEEFALLLPGADEMAALEITENLRQAVFDQTILHADAPIERVVTASFGVGAFMPIESQRYGELVQVAAQALNQAQRSGGNCVVTINGAAAVDADSGE